METPTLALTVVAAILLISLAVTAIVMHRRHTRTRAELTAARQRHSAEESALASRHAEETQQLQAQHDDAVAELRATHDADLSERIAAHESGLEGIARERDEAVRRERESRLLAGRGMRWELASRELLVDACETAGLDAIVATNIVFSPGDDESRAPYCAQIDHLVITEKAVLLIDSKQWRGLVFDGKKPSTMAGALSVLFEEKDLPQSYAIALRRDGGSVSVRTKLGADSPAFGVRRQARRFHQHLMARHGSAPFLHTVVFYSHPDARVWTDGVDEGERGRSTTIASTRTIQKKLVDAQVTGSGSPSSHQLTQLVDTVRQLGADLHGTGRFAPEFQSPVPLSFRVEQRASQTTASGSIPNGTSPGPRMGARPGSA